MAHPEGHPGRPRPEPPRARDPRRAVAPLIGALAAAGALLLPTGPAAAQAGSARCGGEPPLLYVSERQRAAEEALGERMLEEAERDARAAIECDPGPDSFRARQVLIQVLRARGRDGAALREVDVYLEVEGLLPEQVAWGTRVRDELEDLMAPPPKGPPEPAGEVRPEVASADRARQRRIGGALLGGGSVSLGFGVVFLARGAHCEALGQDWDSCAVGWVSRGAVLAAVGVAVDVVGAVMLAAPRTERRVGAGEGVRARPVVGVAPGEGGPAFSLGATGSF